MKPNKQALDDLLASARSVPMSEDTGGESATLPPGLATRIAARWAARPSDAQVWERLTATGLAAALVVCGSAALLRPKPAVEAPDAMLSLFYARPAASADDFPF